MRSKFRRSPPVERSLVPGQIVGVQDPATWEGGGEFVAESGLATRTMTIETDDRWLCIAREFLDPASEISERQLAPVEDHQILTRWSSSNHSRSDSVTPKVA